MAPNTAVAVELLDEPAGGDAVLVDRLAALVNDVYLTAEAGLWRDGTTRTTPTEVGELIGAREIAVAVAPDGDVLGCVRVRPVSARASEFGMLVAHPDHRGTGVGLALVDFAEQHSRDRGMRAMELELLVPRDGQHPMKEFLRSWYSRIGYRLVRTRTMDDSYPHLAPLLATPCDLQTYEKALTSPPRGAGA